MDVKTILDLQQIKITPLPDNLPIQKFKCGVTEIDSWSKNKARKFHDQNRAKVFCAVDSHTNFLCGFYSLAFSNEEARNLTGRYKDIYNTSGVPLVYIQYLAVNATCQKQGLGRFLLLDALRRAYWISQHISFYGVALRSLNDRTTKFYEGHGFGKVDDEGAAIPLMILPIWTINDLFKPVAQT